eukprot:3613052-Pleurochrysis_carterae.AAC.2
MAFQGEIAYSHIPMLLEYVSSACVPRNIRAAGPPTRLSFALGYPPYVAVCVGEKYLLTFDTTRRVAALEVLPHPEWEM